MTRHCCNEYRCTRKQPLKIRFGALSRRWYVVTRYTANSGHVIAQQKHDVHDELVAALLDAGWTPPPNP